MPNEIRKDILEAEKELRRRLVAMTSTDLPDYVARRVRALGHARRVGITKVYSWNNQLSLAAQARRKKLQHLGVYAGPEQFAKVGRVLKANVEPLIACAPVIKKDEETGEDHVVGWFNVEVYDYTDTVADDPDFIEPDFEAPLFAGSDETLLALSAASPVPVDFLNRASALERSSFNGERIVIDTAAPVGNQISALAHQITHARLGDRAHPSSKENEELCVLTQYLFMEIAGLGSLVGNDVAAQAVDNLRRWVDPATGASVEGHKARLKLLHARLSQGVRLANELADAVSVVPVHA